MLESAIADVALPGRISLCGRLSIALIVIDQQQTILVDASMLVAIELSYLASLLNTEEILVGTYAWLAIEVEVSHLVGIARQLSELGVARAPVNPCGPLQGTLRQHVVLQRYLETCVLGGTDIDENRVVDEGGLWSGIVIEQVLRTTVEVLDATTQAIVEGDKVQTNVEGLLLLPGEVWVGIQRRSIAIDPLTIDEVSAVAAIGSDRLIGIEVRTTCNTIRDAGLQTLED